MSLEAAWWLTTGVNSVAAVVAVLLIFYTQYTPNLHHAVRRGKLCLLGWIALLAVLGVLLPVTFLLDEGTTVRADAVLSYWARWAWYIPQNVVLFWIVAKWLWHGSFAISAGTALAALSSTLALFAVLSISISHWVWFFLSLALCVVLAAAVIILKMRMDSRAWVAIVLFVVPVLASPILMGLGPHLGDVVSLEVETWVFTLVDCLIKTLFPFLLWYTFCPIDLRLIEHPEIDGYLYKQCPPKCRKVNEPAHVCAPCAYEAVPEQPCADPCQQGPSMLDRMRNFGYRYRPSDGVSCANGQCVRPVNRMMPGAQVQDFNSGTEQGGYASQRPGFIPGGNGSAYGDLQLTEGYGTSHV